MTDRLAEVYRFDRFTLDLRRGMLLGSDGTEIALRPKSFVLLRMLVENAGQLLDRDTLMEAIWPGVFVTDESIAQCVKDVRRALGDERQSLVKTVVKRGYILTTEVTSRRDNHFVAAANKVPGDDAEAGFSEIDPHNDGIREVGTANRATHLSIVLVPFENLGGNPDDYLAAAITEDLTTDLCRLEGARIITSNSAMAWRGNLTDVRRMGEALGVRYVIDGSTRRLGDIVRINVKLIATETNTYLWAGRLDHDLNDVHRGLEAIVSRLRAELVAQIFAVESRRSVQERPDNPDAFDLLLRARSLLLKHDQPGLLRNASELYEQALRLDPSSVSAMCELASQLINRFINFGDERGNGDLLQQAITLVNAAAAIEPNSETVIYRQGYLLRALGRWTEAIAVLRRLVELFPHSNHGFRQLGFCTLAVGQAEAAIQLLQRSIDLNPLAPHNRHAYQRMAQAHLLLGRDADAIAYAHRALADGTANTSGERGFCYWLIASARALMGQLATARQALTEAKRLNPFATVRTMTGSLSERGLPDPTYMAQMDRMRQGLRIAGLREHAEEDADFGVASDGTLQLHRDLLGLTPRAILGATTIRTAELADLLAHREPVLIDVARRPCGRSLPGAIGLQGTGYAAAFSDPLQARFRRKIHELTHADRSTLIIACCANSEHFSSYNLVLRLLALGYTQVYWYRGGWEAWQVAGLPDTPLELQEWSTG